MEGKREGRKLKKMEDRYRRDVCLTHTHMHARIHVYTCVACTYMCTHNMSTHAHIPQMQNAKCYRLMNTNICDRICINHPYDIKFRSVFFA